MRRLALVPMLLALAACGSSRAPEPTAANGGGGAGAARDLVLPAGSTSVKIAQVELRQLPDDLEVPARISADPTRVYRVFSPVSGRLVSLGVRPGDAVRAGETVAVLESADVSSARADYLHATTEYDRAQHAFERAGLLFEHEVLSDKDYRDARAARDEAASELNRTRDRLRVLGIDPGDETNRLRVASTRAGAVLDVGAAPGELSKSLDSSTPLCTIADLATVWAIGDVQEKDLGAVKRGDRAIVNLAAYPGAPIEGHIDSVSDTLDPTTRTAKIRVVLNNRERRFKPEMFATITVTRSLTPRTIVPAAAVLRQGQAASVIVQHTPGRFRERPVTLGRRYGTFVEVTAGLTAGDVIVVEGAGLLRPGA